MGSFSCRHDVLFIKCISLILFIVFTNKSYGQTPELYQDGFVNGINYRKYESCFSAGAFYHKPTSETGFLRALKAQHSHCQDSAGLEQLRNRIQRRLSAKAGKKTAWLSTNFIDNIKIFWTTTNQSEVAVATNLLAPIDASLQPLLFNRAGRTFGNNQSFYLESTHVFHLFNKVEIVAVPQFSSVSSRDTKSNVKLQNLYASVNLGNIELTAGKFQSYWGPRISGGLLFGKNARPLTQIKLTTPIPFRLPGVIGNIGSFKFSTVLATLGENYSVPNAKLTAYKIDYQPNDQWNIGVEHMVIFGGDTISSPSFPDVIWEYSGILKGLAASLGSNHIIGANIGFSPRSHKWKAYAEAIFEDQDKDLKLMLLQTSTWMFGFLVPIQHRDHNASLRLEFIRASPRSFRHSIYTDGYALEGKILGYAGGPDTYSAHAIYTVNPKSNYQFSFNVRFINRIGNTYRLIQSQNAPASSIDFIRLEVLDNNPDEYHHLITAKGLKVQDGPLSYSVELGLDYVRNQEFVRGKHSFQYMAQIELNYRFFNNKNSPL